MQQTMKNYVIAIDLGGTNTVLGTKTIAKKVRKRK